MTTDFDWAFSQLLVLEGIEQTNTPGDPGGDTILGVSQHWWPEWHARIVAEPTWTGRLCIAKQFFFKTYWIAEGCDKIPNKYVAYEIFEMSVNLGSPTVHDLLRDALAKIACPDLATAIERGGYIMTVWWLNVMQYRRYNVLVEAHPEKMKFYKGWQRRCWDTTEAIAIGTFTR